jgi:hypothetical protein
MKPVVEKGMRLETAGQLVLNNQSKIRTSLLHLLDGFRTVFQADDERDGGVGLPKFPQDGRRITCAIDVLKITLNFARDSFWLDIDSAARSRLSRIRRIWPRKCLRASSEWSFPFYR